MSSVALERLRVSDDGVAVVESLELRAESGEWLCLIGPNGAGKTSVLRAIAGLARFEGEVRIDAAPARALGPRALARKVAMHITAMSPKWVERESIPEEDVERERQIFLATDEVQSKPEQARERIVEGMLNKRFFGANVLLEQEWIHDSSKKVGDALADEGAEVLEFERFELSA